MSTEAATTSFSVVEAEPTLDDSRGEPIQLDGVENGRVTVRAAPTPTATVVPDDSDTGGGFQSPTATPAPEPTPVPTAQPTATPAPTAARAQPMATPAPTEPAGFDPAALVGVVLLVLAILEGWWYRRA